MPRFVKLTDGTTAMYEDNVTDAEIDADLRKDGLVRVVESGPVAPGASERPSMLQAMRPEAGGVAGLSLVNSLAFGLPEMAARALGGGAAIDRMRQESPIAATAGEVAGLANPARMGMNALRNLTTRAGTVPATGIIPEVARRTRDVGGATVGAQAAYSQLGAASRPDDPMAGAQTYAQLFRNAAQNLPGMQLIPGAQPTVSAVTGAVPGLLGMADIGGRMAATNFQDIERDRRIKEEAARRALQGQR